MAGDVFQLGNASWRVLQVAAGTVRVADAKGAPPNIPFWLGEAPARSDELSHAVSQLREDVDRLLGTAPPSAAGPESAEFRSIVDWFIAETGVSREGAEQALCYLAEARRVLGILPTQHTLVLERFFDESGGMQLVLHAPFGSRVTKAWGLALRKRFCRQFNFELQAAATDDALMLSLGPQHSFPLSDGICTPRPRAMCSSGVPRCADVRRDGDGIPRWRSPSRIRGAARPPQLQRCRRRPAAVFFQIAACLENIPGDRDSGSSS
jgi:ATP-dependent Lhr-like helicase